ncbi:MAG: hypothetical protein ACREIA_24205 [Opitutaceae bacterium]
MALPTAPFDAAKSLFSGLNIIEFTPTGGSKLTFESKKLDHQYAPEYFEHKRPDASGVLRIARKVLVGSTESWMYEVDEAKRLLDLFSNSLAGIVDGVCTLWQPDPSDASGKVAMKSAEFACTVEREGDLAGGNSALSIAQIKITSKKLGPVTFTKDADV